MTRANQPIADRLSLLGAQWAAFAENQDARLLVWQATTQELPLIEAFLAKEGEPGAAETEDVFVRLTEAYENPLAHGFSLREALIGHYEEAKPELAGAGVRSDWVCPHARDNDDVRGFVEAVVSLRKAYLDQAEGVFVAWLDPRATCDDRSYMHWLQRLVHQAPANVRFIVVDDRECPAYAPLLATETSKVQGIPCDLDMPAAMQQLATNQDDGTPGGRFRVLLAQVGQLAGKGQLDAALPVAQAAIALATAQVWPHLAAVVHMMLGGAYAAQGQMLAATQAYTEAEALGALCEQQAARADAPPAEHGAERADGEDLANYGTHLRLQARFGQGAALIALGAWKQAAEVYLHAAPLAMALENVRGELDCHRLASVCFEQSGAIDKAWGHGVRGLQLGLGMDDETRATSTLPYLCDHLDRFTRKHAAYHAHHEPLVRRFEELLGPHWRSDDLARGAPPS